MAIAPRPEWAGSLKHTTSPFRNHRCVHIFNIHMCECKGGMEQYIHKLNKQMPKNGKKPTRSVSLLLAPGTAGQWRREVQVWTRGAYISRTRAQIPCQMRL